MNVQNVKEYFSINKQKVSTYNLLKIIKTFKNKYIKLLFDAILRQF